MDLQEVERDFRCLKGQLRLRPNYHWTEKRIKAHIFICVLALQMERYIITRQSTLGLSSSKAIESLQRVKLGQMVVHGNEHKLVTTPVIFTQKDITKNAITATCDEQLKCSTKIDFSIFINT